MKRKWLTKPCCFVIGTLLALCAVGCGSKDPWETQLKAALQTYLASNAYVQAAQNPTTAQDRVPLLYLKYIDGNHYTQDSVAALQTNLRFIDDMVQNGAIDDATFDGSTVQAAGWNSIVDYLYTWSLCYNQYLSYCAHTNEADAFADYIPMISTYVRAADSAVQSGNYIGVAWGYAAENVLPLIAANLGLQNVTPYCDTTMLSYYEKENGAFVKTTECGNWNGFTGRPLAASLYRDNAAYDVTYEKAQQGYYIIDGNAAYPYALSDCVTLDNLCEHFVYTLQSDYGELTVNPQYALLTAMAHGLDMTRYQKTTGGKTVDAISLWRESIQDADGNYSIDNVADMAVAIAYLARKKGVTAPTPVGLYAQSQSVLTL